jgi:hypothetical protein
MYLASTIEWLRLSILEATIRLYLAWCGARWPTDTWVGHLAFHLTVWCVITCAERTSEMANLANLSVVG